MPTSTREVIGTHFSTRQAMFEVEAWMDVDYERQIRHEAKKLDLPLWAIRRLDALRGDGPYAHIPREERPYKYFHPT